VLLVCADGDPVGNVGLHDVDTAFGTAELGYYVHPDAWSNGYATDAVGQVVGYAFAELRLHKVSARCFEHNDGSRRVLEKNGFQREGVLREEAFVNDEHVDMYRYGLLAEEWRASR
jgi:RimJ/RimL family protein N-acetyltransferase